MSREPTNVVRKLIRTGAVCSAKDYWRAAIQRLEVATFLLERSDYFLDALYLAGYAAECSLKALILERTPKAKRAAVCEEIGSGVKAHNLDFLEENLNRRRISVPVEVTESLNAVKREWSTDLRYLGAAIPNEESKNFRNNVLLIYQWVERSK